MIHRQCHYSFETHFAQLIIAFWFNKMLPTQYCSVPTIHYILSYAVLFAFYLCYLFYAEESSIFLIKMQRWYVKKTKMSLMLNCILAWKLLNFFSVLNKKKEFAIDRFSSEWKCLSFVSDCSLDFQRQRNGLARVNVLWSIYLFIFPF